MTETSDDPAGPAGARPARRRSTETIVSVAAMIVAITAVVVALYEARINREYQQISVWPYITQYNVMSVDGPYTRHISNEGIGPARVQSFQIRVDGEPVGSWPDFFRALLPDDQELRGDILRTMTYSAVHGATVILPGREISVLHVPAGPGADRVFMEMNSGRVGTELCYCSLYDECWLSREQGEPESIGTC